MQARTVAGVSLTAQTAVLVKPARPAGPTDAITDTADVRWLSAARNSPEATDSEPVPLDRHAAGAEMIASVLPRTVITPLAYAPGPTYTIHPWIWFLFHRVM